MGEIDKTQHVLPLETPVVWIDAKDAFEGLEERERLYVYHLCKASWIGSLCSLLQVSSESGPLFVMLHKLFRKQLPEDFKKSATSSGFTEDEVNALFIYTAGIFSNCGNYKGFGDLKIIPGIEFDRFEGLLKVSQAWPEIESIWESIKDTVYDLSNGRTCLGYRPHGITTYLSSNITAEDAKVIQQWMSTKNLGLFNTRAFKSTVNGKTQYEIRLASEETGEVLREEQNGCTFVVTKGDYGAIMGAMAKCLLEAVPYAANENQTKMLKLYAKSFQTGNLKDHIEGSRYWIKDKGPIVETYIGFIENYRDPAGQRGEFEGFVAVVNKEMTKKFNVLVERAEEFLNLLPWPPSFEKDKFTKPDFTSLDVICFAGSGIPVGINIPNYEEIRQTEGFKNVSLGNVLPSSFKNTKMEFLTEEDKKLMDELRVHSFEVQVGLHELLGHGSGKLFKEEADGKFNFDKNVINPLRGTPVKTWYRSSESYDTVFTSLGSAFEECRAEAVGLFLCLEPHILSVFGLEGTAGNDIIYVNWLSMAWAGLQSLEMWDPKRGWLQAHSQARFALLNVLLQASVAKLEQPTPTDLLVTLDRNIIFGVGRQVVGNFLMKLQVIKATADIDAATKLFDKYTAVTGHWLEYRQIVLAGKKPRRMFTQPNVVLLGDGQQVQLVSYEATPEGLLNSWIERFPLETENVYQDVLRLSEEDKPHFYL